MYRHYDARPLSVVTWASDPRYVPGAHTVRAEAVIERDGSILLIKVDDAGFVHYSLPGGGEVGESVRGLVREFREETVCEVAIGDLFFAHADIPEPTADVNADASALLRRPGSRRWHEGRHPRLPRLQRRQQPRYNRSELVEEVAH